MRITGTQGCTSTTAALSCREGLQNHITCSPLIHKQCPQALSRTSPHRRLALMDCQCLCEADARVYSRLRSIAFHPRKTNRLLHYATRRFSTH